MNGIMIAIRLLGLLLLFLTTTACSKKIYVVHNPLEKSIVHPPHLVNDFSFAPYASKLVVILDPGHGGKDFGTEASNTKEKEYNLITSKLVASYLRQIGFHVSMTRDDDRFLSLAKRAAFANNLQGDIFVSIHYNSAPNPSAEGIEVFYYKDEKNPLRRENSKYLAQTILNNVIITTGAKSRGVKQGNLAVIRETTMDAVLIECGFLTNPAELAKIDKEEYRKLLAKGISLGIRDYMQNKNK